jgi:Sulfotransferase domain
MKPVYPALGYAPHGTRGGRRRARAHRNPLTATRAPATDDIEVWHRAVNGDQPDWNAFLAEYTATVDWPACAFWREISAANPDAVILLSSRDTDGWWRSASNTIFTLTDRPEAAGAPPGAPPSIDAQRAMAVDMLVNTFTPGWRDEAEAKRAYEAHNADVRASAPADRLIDWHPGDGWKPICDKLGLPVPAEPFPHVNTTDEFRAMLGMEPLDTST